MPVLFWTGGRQEGFSSLTLATELTHDVALSLSLSLIVAKEPLGISDYKWLTLKSTNYASRLPVLLSE